MCLVCTAATARYTCPQCGTSYCSSACYRVHGARCTEQFYEAQVRGQLRGEGVDEAARSRMLGVLRARVEVDAAAAGGDALTALTARLQLGEAGGAVDADADVDADAEAADADKAEGGGTGLGAERLAQLRALAEGDAGGLTLDVLTAAEQRAFLRAAAGAQLAAAVGAASWEPWWEQPVEQHHAEVQRGAEAVARGQLGGAVARGQLGGAVARGQLGGSLRSGAAPAGRARVALIEDVTPGAHGEQSVATVSPSGLTMAPRPASPSHPAVSGAGSVCIALLPSPPTPLCQLRGNAPPPSPLLPAHIADALFGYCHIARLYAGDWRCEPDRAAAALLAVSRVLGSDARPPSVEAALRSAMEAALAPGVRLTAAPHAAAAWAVAADVARVMGERHYVADALADARRCLEAAAEGAAVVEGLPPSARGSGSLRALAAASRKLTYFLSWACDVGDEGKDDAVREQQLAVARDELLAMLAGERARSGGRSASVPRRGGLSLVG